VKRLLLVLILLAVLALGFFAGPTTKPALAQGGVWWQAQFYNNTFLIEPAVFTTYYNGLALNWGAGSPGSGVNPDGFSARIATDTYFAAGTYRFYILADDAIKLWIDFPPTQQATIDTFDAPRPGVTLTADVTLTAGSHHIQVDFKENTGDAYLYVTWANLATNPTGPNFPNPPTNVPAPTTGPWTGQYYNNGFLGGTPTVTVNEASPSHNWGEGVPIAGLPADNFSARWTSFQTLNAGAYQISVKADDGVRVFVDGNLLINEFHTASGQTYTASVNLAAGVHTFVVEYFEAGGAAFLEFNLLQAGGSAPPPTVPGGPTATVIAYRLNVRNAPTAIGSTVLTRISRNETYSIVGRNAAGSWWQINVNGLIGWVSGRYIAINNEQNVPVTDGGQPAPQPTQPPVQTGITVTARSNLNIRSGPGLSNPVIGRLPYLQSAQIVGRNAAGTWWHIQYGGLTGWVSSLYANLREGANVNIIPVTG